MTTPIEGTPGNVERNELSFPAADGLLALADSDGHALPVERPGAQVTRAVLAALQDSGLGLELDERNLLCLRYGPAAHVVCVSRQAVAPERMPDLLKHKIVLGAVATRAIGDEDWRVDHLLLAEPVAGLACSVHVMVQRRSGELVMAGWGELAHGQLLFHLHAVKRPGAVPVAIAGCLGDGRLDITHAAASMPDAMH
ncbi:hypothetical protein ASD15_07180 [Massilia sp. Root351]|uniref:hypothetical protein n=1 Tax=Massilia sp. Root351 TaxID=1736522 RepID=UPI00070D99E8|nr:hypothetical protein [Massilia sp. Root351]KQV84919.1 hypothetical protein ASD15_07180 [Massilia sp. Root351]